MSRRLLIAAAISSGIAIAIFVAPALPASATITSVIQTTVADFNPGQFYRTGLTNNTESGGDGNGEVRLMTVGISPSKWKSDGNVTGLAPLQGHAAVQKNGRIYVSGGGIPGLNAGTRFVSYTTILSATTHNLTDWTGTSLLPITLTHHGMAVVNNYLYVMGGSYALVPTSTVFYAPINPDGSVGTWNSTQSLPDIRSDFGTVVVSGTIYVIGGGGAGDVPTNSVYYAKPSGGGTISSWYTATAPLPTTLARHSAVADNGMIYIVGGYDGSTYYPDVYYAIPTSGGDVTSWTKASTTLQQNLILASGVAFGGQLYVAGGAAQNGTVLTKTITSNLLNLDSTPSSWVYSFVLSDPRQRTAAAVSDDGWIYVIEGSKDPVTPLNTIDYGPTSASGSTYVNNGTYTSPIINLSGSYTVTSINWNAFVSQTVSMTLQYKTGNSPDLTAVAWSSPFYATVNNASPVTNTVDTSSQPKAQFVQYLVNLSTLNTASSPVLNAVQVVYDKPALPDFVVTNIQAPPKPTSAMTQTITVSVLNQGEVPYRLTRSNPLKVITQSVAGMPPLPRKSSASLTLTGTYTQTTNYYFYVDVYVDPTITPTLVTDVPATPCASTTFPSEKPFIYSLTMPIGVIVQVQANCWVVPHPDGSPNVFYAQADTCEDLSGNDCSTTYGRILEKNETNNILGPVYSGTGGGSKLLFLPFIER